MLDHLEFYEGELELLDTPKKFKEFLYEMHEEFELLDVSGLLEYYLENEKYEYCQIIKEFIDNEITKG